jgi:outer membrane lipoprotein-sorting protein
MTKPSYFTAIFSAVLLLLHSTVTQAASSEQIAKIVQQINGIHFLQGEFTQEKTLKDIAYPLKAQGHFMFWKGQGLYLATEKPFFNAITITGGGLINWQADGTGTMAQEQASIIQREVNKTLLAFFSADTELIEQRFNVEWVFDKNNWQLSLTPKLEMIQKNMRIAIIRGSHYMNELDVIAANGDKTHLVFSAQQESTQPTASDCRWFYINAKDSCSKFQ